MSTTQDSSSECIACKLCSKHNPKIRTLFQMKNHDKFKVVFDWLSEYDTSLDDSDSICLPCIKQIANTEKFTQS